MSVAAATVAIPSLFGLVGGAVLGFAKALIFWLLVFIEVRHNSLIAGFVPLLGKAWDGRTRYGKQCNQCNIYFHLIDIAMLALFAIPGSIFP